MKFIFEPTMNLFDFVAIIILSNLMSLYSLWFGLLFIPVVLISSYLKRKYGSE